MKADDLRSTPAAKPSPLVLDTRPIFERGGSPCGAIDDAAARLKPGQSLVLLVPFEPVPLYTKLGALGFEPHPEELPDGTWQVEFVPGAETSSIAPGSVACGCTPHSK